MSINKTAGNSTGQSRNRKTNTIEPWWFNGEGMNGLSFKPTRDWAELEAGDVEMVLCVEHIQVTVSADKKRMVAAITGMNVKSGTQFVYGYLNGFLPESLVPKGITVKAKKAEEARIKKFFLDFNYADLSRKRTEEECQDQLAGLREKFQAMQNRKAA